MKRSKFTDEQILAIVKESEAGRKVAELCRTYGSASKRTSAGSRSTEAWSSIATQRAALTTVYFWRADHLGVLRSRHSYVLPRA